jgi:hypothetical protein
MRPASTGHSAQRANVRERQRRDRAAAQLLRERYPQFDALRFEFEFSGAGQFTPVPQVAVLHPPARTYFFFPCPFADCDGEFDLTEPVAQLAQSGGPRAAGQLVCGGSRTRERDRQSPCGLQLEYVIAVTFA